MPKETDSRYRVTRRDDGSYFWMYDQKARGNDTALLLMVKICAIIWAVIAAILLALLRNDWPTALLIVGSIGAGIVLLPLLLWKLVTPPLGFLLTETYVESWPRYRGRNLQHYDSVQRVILSPYKDMIHLRAPIGGAMLFVPPEDYEFVRDFILARIPPRTEITRE